MGDTISKVNGLTPEQREQAYTLARLKIAGRQPQLADFVAANYQRYPKSLVDGLRVIAYIVLFSAFLPSAIRIFKASYDLSAGIIAPETEELTGLALAGVIVIAAMSIVLAETGQVAFTLWAATVETDGLRRWLWIGAIGCTGFALVANAQIVRPWDRQTEILLAYIETFLPPVLVLIASHVLKAQALHDIESAEKARQAYQKSVKEWTDKRDNAEFSDKWLRVVATALKQAIMDANAKKTAVLREVTDEEWRALVVREMRADGWWADKSVQQVADRVVRSAAVRSSADGQRKRTGVADGQADENGRGHATGMGYTKRTDARTRVWEYLNENPEAADMTVRDLAETIGVGKSTVSDVVREWRAGQAQVGDEHDHEKVGETVAQ